jgi:RimJ/RimL family protein N-acetyltransferase
MVGGGPGGGRAVAEAFEPILTPRLMLRPFAPGDEDAMALVFGDAAALRFWGTPLGADDIRGRIERNRERLEADGFARWAIVDRERLELIGDAGLSRTDVEGAEEIELGWVVRSDRVGMGYATEAGAAWRDRAFGALGLRRIVSMIRPANGASRRVADKLGMSVERQASWNDAPHLMYVLER